MSKNRIVQSNNHVEHHVNNKLSEDEANELRNLDSILLNLKIDIADFYRQRISAEAGLEKATKEFNGQYDKYIQKIKDFAVSRGIDVDDPSKGKWNFDYASMTFTKLD